MLLRTTLFWVSVGSFGGELTEDNLFRGRYGSVS